MLPLMHRRILKVSKMEGGRKLFKNSLNRMLFKNDTFKYNALNIENFNDDSSLSRF